MLVAVAALVLVDRSVDAASQTKGGLSAHIVLPRAPAAGRVLNTSCRVVNIITVAESGRDKAES